MNLILSDRGLAWHQEEHPGVELIDVSKLTIANCVGCFGCWTKTPGRCVIRDDAVKVYPRIAACSRLLCVSRVKYGGYDTVMKTLFERCIPVQQAFIRLLDGETHHVQRRVAPKQAVIIAYGEIPPEEQAIFRRLVERNGKNMSFERCRVVFAGEEDLEGTVGEEVAAWER